MKEKLKYNSIITARIVLYTVKRFMVTFLGVMLLINLLPTEMIPESGETAIIPEAFAATTLHNPGIVADSSMASGQKVTWDCIYFGTYPQTEIVDEIPQCGTYGKSWSLLSDYDVDLTLYSKLTKADWDSRGDAYINGTKYHRVKSSNATYSNSGDYWYHWDSNESYHYFRYDKIKWRVLQKEGQKVFLLSDSILDDKRYNEKTGSSSANRITWETSTLRSWLNGKGSDANNNQIDFTGKGFIDVAFNNTEKCAIEDVNVDNHSTAPTAGTNGGNDTNDKVFLLSEYDMFYSDRSASYGFCKNSYSVCDEARRGRGTAYAIAMGLNTDTEKKYKGNTWWLRSPGRIDNTSLAVSEGGHLDICAPCTNGDGIRPAVIIDLSNPDLWCYAGTVSSDGSVFGSLNSAVSWEYSGGILTIQGSGEMPDYNTASYYNSGVDSNVPWENYLASIIRVTISGNITSIGNCCFACCPSLSELSLSSSIKEIGEAAFSGCTGLATFPFPENLITIEDKAFMGCTGISEMDIPNCVQTIGDDAFSGCNGLRRIKLSSSLTELSSGLFNLCRSL